jgi:hypothetical protein
VSGARIEVFQHDINDRYRQIELAGSPVDISRAAEKIYKVVNKYYFVSPTTLSTTVHRRTGSSEDRDRKQRRVSGDEPRSRIRLMKKHRGNTTLYY